MLGQVAVTEATPPSTARLTAGVVSTGSISGKVATQSTGVRRVEGSRCTEAMGESLRSEPRPWASASAVEPAAVKMPISGKTRQEADPARSGRRRR